MQLKIIKPANVIDLSEVGYIAEALSKIDKISVLDVILMKDGKEVVVSEKDRDDFQLTGLSTFDFAMGVG